MCHLLYILLNNAELTCDYHLPVVKRIGHFAVFGTYVAWDISSFYGVQVLLSPRYWCQVGHLGSLSAKWMVWLQ